MPCWKPQHPMLGQATEKTVMLLPNLIYSRRYVLKADSPVFKMVRAAKLEAYRSIATASRCGAGPAPDTINHKRRGSSTCTVLAL